MKTFYIYFKADITVPRIIQADKMKVDGSTVMFICDADPKDKRIVAVVNVDAIKEAYENPN